MAVRFLEGDWAPGEFGRREYDDLCVFREDDAKQDVEEHPPGDTPDDGKVEEPQEGEPLQSEPPEADAGADGDDEADGEEEDDPEESASEQEVEDGEDDGEDQQPGEVRCTPSCNSGIVLSLPLGSARCSLTAVDASGGARRHRQRFPQRSTKARQATSATPSSRTPRRTRRATLTRGDKGPMADW